MSTANVTSVPITSPAATAPRHRPGNGEATDTGPASGTQSGTEPGTEPDAGSTATPTETGAAPRQKSAWTVPPDSQSEHDLGSPLVEGVPLGELVDSGVLAATVLAGRAGLGRTVERLNVMEVPDILEFVKPNELLVTTAYPLRDEPDAFVDLVIALDDAGLAGVGVKLGRYLETLPAAALRIADERNFPILQLADDTSFDVVLHDILAHILTVQTDRLQRSERIHRTFLQLVVAGGGTEAIVAELSNLIDMPTAIVGLDGAVLASHRLGAVTTTWSTPPDELVLSIDTGHVRVDADHHPVLVAAIAAGPRLFGHVIAVPPKQPGPGTSRTTAHGAPAHHLALESAATVTALALSMASEIQAVESKYQSDLVHDLLTGRIGTTADVLRRANAFGWDLDRPLITLVLQFEEPGQVDDDPGLRRRTPLASGLAPRLRGRDPRVAVVRFSEEVVVLTAPFDGPTARTDARTFLATQVAAAAEATGLVVSGGLSRPVATVADIPRGYEQAVSALTIGRRIQGPGHVAHFDELGAHRVLALIDDVEELRSFASEVLGDLAADDEITTDLRHTLEVLLTTNLNVAESARRLHFHYNTLRYRIDKLEGMVGPFMDNSGVRLNIQLALLILGMRGL